MSKTKEVPQESFSVVTLLEKPLNILSAFLFSQYSFAGLHAIMFLFLFEVMGELIFNVSAIALVSPPSAVSQVEAYLIVLFVPSLAPLIPFLIGLIPILNQHKIVQAFFVTVNGAAIIVLRCVIPFIPNPARAILCSICCFAFMIYFNFVLGYGGLSISGIAEHESWSVGAGLAMGILMKIFWVTCGRNIDLLLYPISPYFTFTFILAIYALIMLAFLIIYQVDENVCQRINTFDYIASSFTSLENESEEDNNRRNKSSKILSKVKKSFSKSIRNMSVSRDIEMKDMDDDAADANEDDAEKIIYIGEDDDEEEIVENVEKDSDSQKNPCSLINLCKEFLVDWRVLFLSFGIVNNITLIMFTVAHPMAMSRWVDQNPVLIHAFVLFSIIIYVFMVVFKYGVQIFPRLRIIGVWIANACIIAFISSGAWSTALKDESKLFQSNVLIMCFLFATPFLFTNVQILWYDIVRRRPFSNLTWISIGFSFGYALFILLNLCAAWSVLAAHWVPFEMRNLYWIVMLASSLAAAIPILFVKPDAYLYGKGSTGLDLDEFHHSKRVGVDQDSEDIVCRRINFAWVILATFSMFLVVAILLFVLEPGVSHVAQNQVPEKLTLLTYSIQGGIDITGNRFYSEILETLQKSNADIIALVDSDTNRPIFNNDDLVRFLANNLRMASYYGPVPTAGTHGLSILSKYPFIQSETKFFETKSEFAYLVKTAITIAENEYRIWGVKLNRDASDQERNINEIIQQVKALSRPSDDDDDDKKENNNYRMALLGDFGFSPNSTSYSILTNSSLFYDTWEVKHNDKDYPGITDTITKERIDYIFFSEDFRAAFMDAEIFSREGSVSSIHLPYKSVIRFNETLPKS